MIYIAVSALALGVIVGQNLFSIEYQYIFNEIVDYSLYILMFSVGISIGMNETILEKIKKYNPTILLVPIGVIIGSLMGGIVCSWLLDMDLIHSLAISASMGWYSLAGVMLESLVDAQIGTIAFLSSLMREFLAFIMIPILVKYLNSYAAIAAAGATSEDTTLPMLIKYSSEEYIIISVINGVLCSVAVPILINALFSL